MLRCVKVCKVVASTRYDTKLVKMTIFRPEYNLSLSTDRFSGRNDVTLDKMHFRPDIMQNIFSKKIKTLRICVALRTIWRYYPVP